MLSTFLLLCDYFCYSHYREIGRMDGADLVRDASGTRTFSGFLVEMTDWCPAAVLPNISLLLGHLDGEVSSESFYFWFWQKLQ